MTTARYRSSPRAPGPGASGGLEGALTSSGTFYGGDQTRSMLLLADGAYLEDTAVAQHLGGDQWGMMNEIGNYPGQPWMWLYTFWYQIKPFSTSDNADAEVWAPHDAADAALMLCRSSPDCARSRAGSRSTG